MKTDIPKEKFLARVTKILQRLTTRPNIPEATLKKNGMNIPEERDGPGFEDVPASYYLVTEDGHWLLRTYLSETKREEGAFVEAFSIELFDVPDFGKKYAEAIPIASVLLINNHEDETFSINFHSEFEAENEKDLVRWSDKMKTFHDVAARGA